VDAHASHTVFRLVVDELPHGYRPLPVRLHVPRRYRSGTILRLTAPRPTSTSGTRLGGRRVAADGSWRPSPLPHVGGKPGQLELAVPPSSAALVTLR